MLETIWNYKLQITPVLFSAFVLESLNILRRHKNIAYTPLYFAIYPLYEINTDLAAYLNHDRFPVENRSIDDYELRKLRKKIISTSILSIVLTALVVPVVCGFIFAFYLEKELLWATVLLVILYKTPGMYKTISSFKYYEPGEPRRNRLLLILVYVSYLGVLFQLTYDSYLWTKPFVSQNDWSGLFYNISNLLFTKGIAGGLLVAIFAWIFTTLITDRDVKPTN